MPLGGKVLLSSEGSAAGDEVDFDFLFGDIQDAGNLDLVFINALTLDIQLYAVFLQRNGQSGLGFEKTMFDTLCLERRLHNMV